MPEFSGPATLMLAADIPVWLHNTLMVGLVILCFSVIIFFHEMGHFLAAKWVGVRVDRFAVGFGPRLVGWRRGEGLTFGKRPEYRPEELERYGYGETDYCFQALPIGGYVKMLGQEDILIDEKTGEMKLSDDPRAFPSRPVGQRMIVVSAGVIFNLLLAALLLTGIFLIGKPETAPIVGGVSPRSEIFGLVREGDRILEVNDRRVDSYEDILTHSVLAEGDLRLKIVRDGREMVLERVPRTDHPQLGLKILLIDFPSSFTLAEDGESIDGRPAPRKGDRIVTIDGRPLQSGTDTELAFARSGRELVRVTVERPVADASPPRTETTDVYVRAALAFLPDTTPDAAEPTPISDGGLLGFQRLQSVEQALDGTPARAAGFLSGDIIIQWGTVRTPVYAEILASIRAGAGVEIPVRVLRGDREVDLKVTPGRAFSMFEETDARVGIQFATVVSPETRAVVADVVPGSPAASLKIPRGAALLAVDDQPAETWGQMADALRAAAGREVRITYRVGDQTVVAPMAVPSSLVNELGLPPTARLESIDGKTRYTWRDGRGNTRELSFPGYSFAVRQALSECVGRTIDIEYYPAPNESKVRKSFTVRADNLDPWQFRVQYLAPTKFVREPLKEIHRADSVLAAIAMSGGQVRDWVFEVYRFLKVVFVQNKPSVKHMSGPVGIVNAAVSRAKAGMIELMGLMALLSVNLAVINFLPIPVMDGGLMMFLIIEKIKGKPLSLKTQMVGTLIGLVGIILVGVIVTFQDIARLFQP